MNRLLKALSLCLFSAMLISPAYAQVAAKYDRSSHLFIHRDKFFAKAEVGDKAAKSFQPHLKLDRWDGECQLSVRLQHNETAPAVTTEGDKIKWKGKKTEAHFYHNGSKVDEGGGYEFEVVLKEKPASNKLSFAIESKGLNFFYQPPLKNLNPDGSTWEESGHGSIVTRPANACGSYAVYHKTRRNNFSKAGGKDYFTGKAFHIYRPRIEDAKGNWTWGELNIDEASGLLTVTIPQDFLDKAAYPVRHAAGLLFGYDHIGASNDYWAGNQAELLYSVAGDTAPATPAASGTLTGLYLYCNIKAGTPEFDPALYSDLAGVPNTRLAYLNSGGTVIGASLGWVHTSLSCAITLGTQYWLGLSSGTVGTDTFNIKFDNPGGTHINYYVGGTPGTLWVNPWTSLITNGGITSIYAEYTAAPTGITAVYGVTTPSAVFGVTSPSAVYGVTP